MKGRHEIEIRNNRCVYKLAFERNLSVIIGAVPQEKRRWSI